MSKATVADRERFPLELRHHRSDDAGAREYHLGPVGLKADDLSPLISGACAVELDLPVDLGKVENRSLHDRGVVLGQIVLDRRKVRDGATHPDEQVRRLMPVETC